MRLRQPSPAMVTVAVCATLLTIRITNDAQLPGQANQEAQPRDVLVSFVLDGDTIETNTGERVRLLGIDAPEIAHHDQAADRYGDESAVWLTQLLRGQRVVLKFDAETKDRYGRTLAWIYLQDGSLVNLKSLETGNSRLLDRFGLPEHLENQLRDAQAQAQVQRQGLWK